MRDDRVACYVALSALLLWGHALAQVPAEVADRLNALGRVINAPATAALYAPRAIEREPYAAVNVERDIHYGPAERNLLDVFAPDVPAAQKRPVLIFVHGGGFARGDRRLSAGSPFYDNVMLWAVRNGMVGVNMTYRFLPQASWPSGAEDVGLALRWVTEQIAARGGDPKRIFLFGHSTGAVNVADCLAGVCGQSLPGSGLAGALLMSGYYRITPELVASAIAPKAYYGDDPTEYDKRSSQRGVANTRIPLWLGHAELDPPEFEAQTLRLNSALCDAGRCPTFVRLAGHSHMSEAYSIHTDDRSVGAALLAFIRAH